MFTVGPGRAPGALEEQAATWCGGHMSGTRRQPVRAQAAAGLWPAGAGPPTAWVTVGWRPSTGASGWKPSPGSHRDRRNCEVINMCRLLQKRRKRKRPGSSPPHAPSVHTGAVPVTQVREWLALHGRASPGDCPRCRPAGVSFSSLLSAAQARPTGASWGAVCWDAGRATPDAGLSPPPPAPPSRRFLQV